MKRLLALLLLPCALPASGASSDYVEHFDTIYNSLTVERRGTVVELRARSNRGDFRESAVDLADPLTLQIGYTRTLFAGLFFKPAPQKVLMVGLGGAGFHRLFAATFPQTLLQTVELDPKVVELTKERLGFKPTDKTPVATMDGRQYVKRTQEKWDWIILDAYRGGYVPPHLKTKEFYQECAKAMTDDGILLANLHATTQLFYADIKTLSAVFPQVYLFRTASNPGNVIACCLKAKTPSKADPSTWTPIASLNSALQGHIEMSEVRAEFMTWPTADIAKASVLTDDFSPAEFLDAMKAGDTTEK